MSGEYEQYFDAYEDLSVHAVMLSDKPRNVAYREALAATVRDKVVMDVGAGTRSLPSALR